MSGPEGEPHTSAEVIRAIIEGQGWVTYVLKPSALAMFLDGAEVRTVAETPDDYLRELCVESGNEANEASVRRISRGDNCFSSEDLGMDLMRRLFGEDERIALLCDPQYSPVIFQLRHVEEDTSFRGLSPTEIMQLGHPILLRLLEPPNLA